MKRFWIIVFFCSMGLFLTACRPNVVTPTLACEASGTCVITVKNEERNDVEYQLWLGDEPQGRPAIEEFRPSNNAPVKYHDHWRRNPSIFFSKTGVIKGGETLTFNTTLPKELRELAGYSLLQLRVRTSPPGWSTAYGEYFSYAAYVIPGHVDSPVVYELDCSNGTATITITNNGGWGDLNFAAYLNQDLDNPWERFSVKADDSLTFTTDPFPADARLLEVDVEGHQADTNWDGQPDAFYHESRGMCIPNTPPLHLNFKIHTNPHQDN